MLPTYKIQFYIACLFVIWYNLYQQELCFLIKIWFEIFEPKNELIAGWKIREPKRRLFPTNSNRRKAKADESW